jgi:hypothetical protein
MYYEVTEPAAISFSDLRPGPNLQVFAVVVIVSCAQGACHLHRPVRRQLCLTTTNTLDRRQM